jgi:hypothetical protein
VLDFSVNDTPMGGTLRIESVDAVRTLHVEAYSPIRIEAVEIVKNGEVVVREPVDRLTVGFDLEDSAVAGVDDVYYARLRLLHDQMVWSSPVWIETTASR